MSFAKLSEESQNLFFTARGKLHYQIFSRTPINADLPNVRHFEQTTVVDYTNSASGTTSHHLYTTTDPQVFRWLLDQSSVYRGRVYEAHPIPIKDDALERSVFHAMRCDPCAKALPDFEGVYWKMGDASGHMAEYFQVGTMKRVPGPKLSIKRKAPAPKPRTHDGALATKTF